MNQRVGDLPAGFMKIAPRCLAGDAKTFCRFLLLKAFKIDKSYQFNLFRLKRDPRSHLFTAAGLIAPEIRNPGDCSANPWTSPSMTCRQFIPFFCGHYFPILWWVSIYNILPDGLIRIHGMIGLSIIPVQKK